MESNPNKVGQRIKDIRTNKIGVSMSKFAEIINVKLGSTKIKSGTVSNWETGKNLPNNERLSVIADLGEMTVDELLYGDDLEKIITLANEIINNNIKNNYDQEYKFFYNPQHFNDLCMDVFTNLTVQNALKENFNEYNVKDFINRKAKEMLRKKAFLPVTNENLVNLVHDQLKKTIELIEDYSSMSEQDDIVTDYNHLKYSDFSGGTFYLPKLFYNQRRIHPELSIELVEIIELKIEKIRTSISELNTLDFEKEIDKIKKKYQTD